MRTLAYSARTKSHFIKPGICLLYSKFVYNNDLNLRQLSTATSSEMWLHPVTASLSFKTKETLGGLEHDPDHWGVSLPTEDLLDGMVTD